MTRVDICADTLSSGWLNTTAAVNELPRRRAFHVVTRIGQPTKEDPSIRESIDQLLARLEFPSVATVANTIFPQALSTISEDSADLASRYMSLYPRLRQFDHANQRGTYFQRLVGFPGKNGQHNQLSDLIRKLLLERRQRGPKAARYEVGFEEPSGEAELTVGEAALESNHGRRENDSEEASATFLPVYSPGLDNSPMAFPCLSACAFQLDDDSLHLLAQYRSQYLILKGYGNYLGLSRLLQYVAEEAGLVPGNLTVVAGYAQVDSVAQRTVRQLTASCAAGATVGGASDQ